MKNKRIQEIINTLSKSGNIKDLTYWADLYRVSKRTIQNDLLEVSKLLETSNQIKLSKSNNQGYFIEGSDKNIKRFKQEYQGNQLLNLSQTYTRHINIMKKIVINNEKITYQQLSDEFFC